MSAVSAKSPRRCETVTFTELWQHNGQKTRVTHTLWQADPNCAHQLDPNCWSGIRCLKCGGWYCL